MGLQAGNGPGLAQGGCVSKLLSRVQQWGMQNPELCVFMNPKAQTGKEAWWRLGEN